jgi:hypothetical protein
MPRIAPVVDVCATAHGATNTVADTKSPNSRIPDMVVGRFMVCSLYQWVTCTMKDWLQHYYPYYYADFIGISIASHIHFD